MAIISADYVINMIIFAAIVADSIPAGITFFAVFVPIWGLCHISAPVSFRATVTREVLVLPTSLADCFSVWTAKDAFNPEIFFAFHTGAHILLIAFFAVSAPTRGMIFSAFVDYIRATVARK
jgi:hypothetical protein